MEELNSKPRLRHFTVPMVTYLRYPTFRLPRVMSDSWTMRSGRSSLTSPMDELVPLHSFPPPLDPPPLSLPLLLLPLGSQLPLPLPLDGCCVTWAPLLLRLVSPLQLDQPDPNPTPQATLPTCRYTPSEIARGLRAFFVSWSYWWHFVFLFGVAVDQQSKNTVSKTSGRASSKVDSGLSDWMADFMSRLLACTHRKL